VSAKLVSRFAALYALLVLVVIGAGLGAYACYQLPSKASVRVARFHAREIAVLRRKQGDTNLTRLADKYLTEQAQAHGLGIVKIVVRRIAISGDTARVYMDATFTDGTSEQTQQLLIVFRRGVWQPTVIQQP